MFGLAHQRRAICRVWRRVEFGGSASASRLITGGLRSRGRLHGPSGLSAPAPITGRHISLVEYDLESFKMRPLNLDTFRRVAYPKIPKRGNWILAAFQG